MEKRIHGYTVELELEDGQIDGWVYTGTHSASFNYLHETGALHDENCGRDVPIPRKVLTQIWTWAKQNGYEG